MIDTSSRRQRGRWSSSCDASQATARAANTHQTTDRPTTHTHARERALSLVRVCDRRRCNFPPLSPEYRDGYGRCDQLQTTGTEGNGLMEELMSNLGVGLDTVGNQHSRLDGVRPLTDGTPAITTSAA